MHTKTQKTLSGLAVGALLLIWFGVALLLFYVPRLTTLWGQAHGELSPARMALVTLVSFVQNYFLILAPPLLAVTTLAIIGRVYTIRKVRATATAS